MITCYIQYIIDPDKVEEFETYARLWIPLVDKYGGTHHGYFLPHEGASDVAVALFSFPSLAAYEKYRLTSADDPECSKAYEYATMTKCIKRYERTFMKPIFNKNTRFMNEQIEYYKRKLTYEMDPSDLYEAFEDNEEVVAVDARQAFGYEKEHIPTAINLPHREMTEASTRHLDKSKTYVCYCDGIGCNASTKGALKMTELGFQVKELMGGIEWWKFDGYATEGEKPTAGTLIQCAC